MRTIIRLAVEALVFLLWIATAVLMLRPKGGCPDPKDATSDYPFHDTTTKDDAGHTVNICVTGEKSFFEWSDQPRTEWDIAVAFDFVEM